MSMNSILSSIKINVEFTASISRFNEVYEYKVLDIDNDNPDREFILWNKQLNCKTEVEKNWFDEELTGRKIKFL